MDLQTIKRLIEEDKLIKFYQCKEWRGKDGVRWKALERDNYECQICKRKGEVKIKGMINEDGKKVKIEVHHIKEIKTHPELALELDNLLTVCVDCHNKEHVRIFQPKLNKWANDEKW